MNSHQVWKVCLKRLAFHAFLKFQMFFSENPYYVSTQSIHAQKQCGNMANCPHCSSTVYIVVVVQTVLF